MIDQPSRFNLYILALLEGCSVLALEILGAKIVASYYGTSLYVWTSVIGVTLIALTLGYYIGGYFSVKKIAKKVLFFNLLLASVFIAYIHEIAMPLMVHFKDKGVIEGGILSAFCLLIFPLVLLGATTPIIIRMLVQDVAESGKTSGRIYALTTIAGIITTFLLGFAIMPSYGITVPLLFTSGILCYYVSYIFFYKSNYIPIAIASVAILISIIKVVFVGESKTDGLFETRYSSEGIFGQIKVVDIHQINNNKESRQLCVNGIAQTFTSKDIRKGSRWAYPHVFSCISTLTKQKNNALVLGVGGGSVVKELLLHNYKVDAVDIDKRIFNLSTNYFDVSTNGVNFIDDDARHFINIATKQYDYIFMDLLSGESQPSHALTKESFNKLKERLSDDGIIAINYQGYAKKQAASSIFKTLEQTGLYCYYLLPGEVTDRVMDVYYVASKHEINFAAVDTTQVNVCCYPYYKNYFVNQPMVSNQLVNANEALIFTDDKPMLEIVGKDAILLYRSLQLKEGLGLLIENNVSNGKRVFD